MQKASDAKKVIDVLGGYEKVRVMCGVKRASVYQWAWLGHFPAKYEKVMAAALKKRNWTADPALWGVAQAA